MEPALELTGQFSAKTSSNEEGWVYDVYISDRNLPNNQLVVVIGFCAKQKEGAAFWQQPSNYSLSEQYDPLYLKALARVHAIKAGVRWNDSLR